MPRRDRPNLLLILTDQQRADSVGWARTDGTDTPVLDALARQGVIFDNAYSASTTCVPARSSLLTGVFDHRLPRAADGRALREGHWTLAHALQAAGYETALFGKMHFCPITARHGFEHVRSCEHLTRFAGYGPGDRDDYRSWIQSQGLADVRGRSEAFVFPYPASHHPTGWIASEAAAFLRSRDASRPYFAVVSFTSPHTPLDPPEPYASQCDPDLEPVPPDTFDETSRELPPAFRAALSAPIGDLFRPRLARACSARRLREQLAATRALVRHIDDSVGQLMQHVSLTDTLVYFTSDHGDYGGHRGLLGKVPWIAFDDLAKVPFFCVGSGVRGGRRIRAPVQSADFALTCLELALITPPAPIFDMRSLASVLGGATADEERSVYSAFSVGWPMIRKGCLKLIWHATGDRVLYDLVADPGETRNLAEERARARLVEDLTIELQLMGKRPPLDLWVARPGEDRPVDVPIE